MNRTGSRRALHPTDQAGDLTGRTALVTGSSRGLGAAIARRLANAGATVAINYKSDLGSAERVCRQIGPRATLWQSDVSKPQDCRRLVQSIAETIGPIDILVLNAGVWYGGRIERLRFQEWSAVIETALTAAYALAHETVPSMRERRFGRIVAISSAIGLTGFPGDAAYSTAKSALIGFVKALSKELGPDGITVNAVAPGLVDTDMTSKLSQRARQAMLLRCALGRPGTPEEVAEAVNYLVAHATYTTGHVLVVDGGMSS